MRGLELSNRGASLEEPATPCERSLMTQSDNEQVARVGIWFFWLTVAGTLLLALVR